MPHRHLVLFDHVSEERALVIDSEGENAVLVRKLESSAVDGAVCCFGDRGEVKAFEGGEHGKF